jgi:hypothetical protein
MSNSPRAIQGTTVPEPGYHNRQLVLAAKIRKLLRSLSPSTYDEIAPKIEYWIEYGITEQFTTTDDLVERLSFVAWECDKPRDVARFFKEFRDASHRSERMRSFIDELSIHVLRWFVMAAAEDFFPGQGDCTVTHGGWTGFARAALFIGHLIKCGLLGHDLVRRHLIKPLIAHHSYDDCRTGAIYQLFVVAGDTLLRGLLEPEDVQVCFERLDTLRNNLSQRRFKNPQYCFMVVDTLGGGVESYTTRLNVQCDFYFDASHYNLTCVPGMSRDSHCVVAVQRGRRAKG